MKITNTFPIDWRDLEKRVCELLSEAGYKAENSKAIETVRGSVNVDVYATSENELIDKFICECKYWNTPVPKEKIHAFRTVVHDSGSMVGIFISKNGFQSGAIEAAFCSNVLLKTWDEFLKLIEKQWVTNQIARIQMIARPLSVYTDPLDVPIDKLSAEEKEEYFRISENCLEEYCVCRVLNWENYLEESIRVSARDFLALDDFLKHMESLLTSAIVRYEKLFSKNPVAKWKFESNEHLLFPLMNGLKKD